MARAFWNCTMDGSRATKPSLRRPRRSRLSDSYLGDTFSSIHQQASAGLRGPPTSPIRAKAPASPQTTPPEAPTPPANGSTAEPPTLAQQVQQAQQQAVAPQRPFHVDLPHSPNPFSAYPPSTAPELTLNNSPRLENLIRDGKLYISLKDAIALAIENNLDLAYFRYNFPIAQTDIQRTKSGSPANGVNTRLCP